MRRISSSFRSTSRRHIARTTSRSTIAGAARTSSWAACHVTSLPEEAAAHADTIFLGPGEDTWPRFLEDFRRGRPDRIYRSQARTLAAVPPIRRDLIKRRLY